MARTDKPKKDGSGTKKSKAKDVVYRQPLGEKGTFAAKTVTLQVKPGAKKKGSKAKAQKPQPTPAPSEDEFAMCENIHSDAFLPLSDIDSFSDCHGEDDKAATPVADDFLETVQSLYLSPLQDLPEQPVEISSTSDILHNAQGAPQLQSELSPSSLRPLPKPLLTTRAPLLQPSVMPASTPPQQAVLFSSPTEPLERDSQRAHILPAIDMFHLGKQAALASSHPVASSQLNPADVPPPAWPTQRTVVHTISPSPPKMFQSAVSPPPEQIPYRSRNQTSGSVTPTSRFKQPTLLSKRPLPQPLPSSPHLLPQPLKDKQQPRKGSRVTVTKGMYEGRRGIVRGVQRAGKKGPPIYGLWSVLLDGKDIVALADEFLALR